MDQYIDPGPTFEIAGFTPKLKSAQFFDDGSEVEVKKSKKGTVLTVPKEKLQDVDTIIVLTLK